LDEVTIPKPSLLVRLVGFQQQGITSQTLLKKNEGGQTLQFGKINFTEIFKIHACKVTGLFSDFVDESRLGLAGPGEHNHFEERRKQQLG
jgi:hypothetical protein